MVLGLEFGLQVARKITPTFRALRKASHPGIHHNAPFSNNQFRKFVFSLSLGSPWHTLATLCLRALLLYFPEICFSITRLTSAWPLHPDPSKKTRWSDRARGQTVVGFAFPGSGKNDNRHKTPTLLEAPSETNSHWSMLPRALLKQLPGVLPPTSVTYCNIMTYPDGMAC